MCGSVYNCDRLMIFQPAITFFFFFFEGGFGGGGRGGGGAILGGISSDHFIPSHFPICIMESPAVTLPCATG